MVNPYDQVLALIKAHYEKDDAKFNSLALFIAEEYSKNHGDNRGSKIKKAIGYEIDNYITRTDEIKNYRQSTNTVHKYYKQLSDGTDIEITEEEFNKLCGKTTEQRKMEEMTEELTNNIKEKVDEILDQPIVGKQITMQEQQDLFFEPKEIKTENKEKESITRTPMTPIKTPINIEKSEGKRHRRTKAEMEAYRNSPEYLEELNRPKRHRRTKAEMMGLV